VSDDLFLAEVTVETGEGFMVASRGDESVVHDAPPGWIIQQVAASGSEVFVVMDDDRSRSRIIEMHPDGSEGVLFESIGTPMFISELAMSHDKLYFTVLDNDGSICIQRRTLTDDQPPETVVCGEPGEDLGWMAVDGSAVSFVQGPFADSGCEKLMVLTDSDTAPKVAAPDDCVFEGAAGERTVAWSRPPVPDSQGALDYFDVPVYGLQDGIVVGLGRGVAGSVTVCRDVAYWLTSSTGGDEIRRWEPDGNVEVIYRSPDQGPGKRYATTKPYCTPDGLLIQRAGWQAGAPDEILVTPPVEWTVQIPPPAVGQPDPDAYLTALTLEPHLNAWAAGKTSTELIRLAQQACKELDAIDPPSMRYQYMMDPETRAVWTERAGFIDESQLWFWRQVATLHMCPRYYLLTVGE
jgi:hypothetical protein